jgi:7-cyano-7-deazaguanine synthase in queuosine biosynthesis
MSRRTFPVDLVATMRLPRDPPRKLKLDLALLTWTASSADGLRQTDPVLLDFLEIARTVHEFDRRQPKRTTGVRVRQIDVTMPLRAPARWTKAAKNELSALLRIQGNADWVFHFTKRQPIKSSADLVFAGTAGKRPRLNQQRKEPPVETIVLFSGGLDSTSGLATLMGQADKTLLVAYYARNLQKQSSIAAEMGFHRLVQVGSSWTIPENAGRVGGQFMYRSLLFLALAIVFADAYRVKSLFQFENGPLALAVQPLDLYRITRHAHPLVHRHLASLFRILTGHPLSVENPFLDKTKGEAVALLKSNLGKHRFKEVIGQTETCWYLSSRTVVAGPPRKKNGEPCGACVPCLVRRAALGADDTPAATDFRNGSGRTESDPVARVHFDSYAAFADQLLDRSYDVHDFMEAVPAATRTVLGRGGIMAPEDAFELYRRFAREWTRTYS